MPNKEKRKNLIITADDFGIGSEANERILKLIRLGKLDRVAIIAHGFFNDKEKKELLESGVKIDLHLNITENISKKRKIKEGVFKEGAIFLLKFFSRKLNVKKVYDSWDNDFRLFQKKFGRNPDGLNSHQHVHFFSPYFKIVLKLKKKYQIPFLRFGVDAFLGDSNKTKKIVDFFRKKNKKRFIASGLESTEYFVSLDWISDLKNFLSHSPEGSIEIACHPEREEEFEKIKEYF